MQGWGRSYRGGVGHIGVGWVMKGWGGVGWVLKRWGAVGHEGVGCVMLWWVGNGGVCHAGVGWVI